MGLTLGGFAVFLKERTEETHDMDTTGDAGKDQGWLRDKGNI